MKGLTHSTAVTKQKERQPLPEMLPLKGWFHEAEDENEKAKAGIWGFQNDLPYLQVAELI